MKEGALLVNVARGPVVDTDALVAALHAGRITAALDVVDPEPLPADSPLWDAPGLLVSPHVGGASSAMWPRAYRLVRDQLHRYRRGRGACEHHVRRLLSAAVDSATWQAGSARRASPRCARRRASTRSSRRTSPCATPAAAPRRGCAPSTTRSRRRSTSTPSRGTFHCFGCQEGGDVIDFLMKIDGLSFVETVERLAEKYGVELKREEGDIRDDGPRGPARGS